MGILDGPIDKPKEFNKIRENTFKKGLNLTDFQKIENIKEMFTKLEKIIEDFSKRFSDINSTIKGFKNIGDSAKEIEKYFKNNILDNDLQIKITEILIKIEKGFDSLNNSFGVQNDLIYTQNKEYLDIISKAGISIEKACGPIAICGLLKTKGLIVDSNVIEKILEYTNTGITGTWGGDLKIAIEKTVGSCIELDNFKNFDDYYNNLVIPSITKIKTGLFNQHYITVIGKTENNIDTSDGLTISKKDLLKFTSNKGGTIWKV